MEIYGKILRLLREGIDLALVPVEKLLLAGMPSSNRYPPLFIVGAPRCGTTLVYLYLIHQFHFSYIPNISKSHPSVPVLFAWLANYLYDYEPTLNSHYGQTEGPMGPSDGWTIFHRWFPEYDYSQPIKYERLEELRRIIAALEVLFDAPFINKNNSNSVRIDEINRLFPDARFVHVKRNYKDAVASLIRARKNQNIPPTEWWSVAPPQFYTRDFTDHVSRAVYQIWGVDKYIEQRLANVSRERRYELSYESFCRDPELLNDWAQSQFQARDVQLRRRSRPSMPALTPRSKVDRLEPGLEESIDRLLQRIDQGHETDFVPE